MIRTTLKIEGMMCSMCEAHIKDLIPGGRMASKVSTLRSCSILQASSRAVSGLTPRPISSSVRSLCRS